MKSISLALLIALGTFQTIGQTMEEQIADKACEKLSSLDTYEHLTDSIELHLTKVTTETLLTGKEVSPKYFTVEGIKELRDNSIQTLIDRCSHVRSLIIQEKSSEFYKLSDNNQANEFFEKGNAFLDKQEYKAAAKAFKKAIKYDSEFVYAYDHLAITYRKQELYKKAEGIYNKSLNIFPEGELALLNIAAIYSLQEKKELEKQAFLKLRYFYPNKAEGYFGLAKMQILEQNFEDALHNICVAHILYSQSDSPYIKDSSTLISGLYDLMKESGQESLFKEITEQYQIQAKQE